MSVAEMDDRAVRCCCFCRNCNCRHLTCNHRIDTILFFLLLCFRDGSSQAAEALKSAALQHAALAKAADHLKATTPVARFNPSPRVASLAPTATDGATAESEAIAAVAGVGTGTPKNEVRGMEANGCSPRGQCFFIFTMFAARIHRDIMSPKLLLLKVQ
jgi:hypothetical protein